MQIAPILARLATVADLDGRVYLAPTLGDAADLIPAKAQSVPIAVLTAPREKADASQRLDNMPAQHRVTCTFAVATCLRYGGEAMQAADALDGIVRAIRAVLLGWIPTGYDRQCFYQGGQLMQAKTSGPSILIWADTFETVYTEDAL